MSSDIEFKLEEVFNMSNSPCYLSKIVNLPNDRIFMIGGAEDIMCKKSYSSTFEIAWNKETNHYESIPKQSMAMTRAAFGCIVYPNYS